MVYFGGLTPHKNINLILDVFAALILDRCSAGLKLILVGDYICDVYYSAYMTLRAQVDALCPGAAIFGGHLDDADAACVLNGSISLCCLCWMRGLDCRGSKQLHAAGR